MVVGFTTTCVIRAYKHYKVSEFEVHSWRGVFDTTLCDKVCQLVTAGQWFSPGIPVSFINKSERYDITEILLKVRLNTLNQPTLTKRFRVRFPSVTRSSRYDVKCKLIQFVIGCREVGGFLQVLWFPPRMKLAIMI